MSLMLCRIAEHLVGVEFCDTASDASLLPSFRPFLVGDDEQQAKPDMLMCVNDAYDFDDLQVVEVGQFDCGGCNHGVYQLEDGSYLFEISDVNGQLCAVMCSNPDFSLCRVALKGKGFSQRNFGLNNSLMIAYAFCFATKGTLLVHASVIRKDGYGYLMTAPSGTGKSTHTHLWYKNIPGCDLMNDDNPVVRYTPEGGAVIYGSPWSGKTPCYRNIQAPIGAFVRIQQRPRNEIRKMVSVEAFTTLLPAVSSMKWDCRVYTAICHTISDIIRKVKVYELGCLPDAEAAKLCYETVAITPASSPVSSPTSSPL